MCQAHNRSQSITPRFYTKTHAYKIRRECHSGGHGSRGEQSRVIRAGDDVPDEHWLVSLDRHLSTAPQSRRPGTEDDRRALTVLDTYRTELRRSRVTTNVTGNN